MSKGLPDFTYEEIMEEIKRRDEHDGSFAFYLHKYFGEYDEVKLREGKNKMTYEQAEAISALRFSPEFQEFIDVQQQRLLAEMEAQCYKGKNTSHGDFLHQSGKIEGIRLVSYDSIFAEAKRVIEAAKKAESTIINET